jgi:CspA family cold shock protein
MKQESGFHPIVWSGDFRPASVRRVESMPEGTIKKLAEKGFGFISSDGGDVFFHMSALVEVEFEELNVGQAVTYEMGDGPKGPRAENVRVV